MMSVNNSSLQVHSQPIIWFGERIANHRIRDHIHESSELMQWLSHDSSTANTNMGILSIISLLSAIKYRPLNTYPALGLMTRYNFD